MYIMFVSNGTLKRNSFLCVFIPLSAFFIFAEKKGQTGKEGGGGDWGSKGKEKMQPCEPI